MIDFTALVVAAKTLVLILGGMITALAYRAAQRTASPALRTFAVGFGTITLGAILGGSLDWFTAYGIHAGVFVQSTLTALGFAVLAYSLYATHDGPDRVSENTLDDRGPRRGSGM